MSHTICWHDFLLSCRFWRRFICSDGILFRTTTGADARNRQFVASVASGYPSGAPRPLGDLHARARPSATAAGPSGTRGLGPSRTGIQRAMPGSLRAEMVHVGFKWGLRMDMRAASAPRVRTRALPMARPGRQGPPSRPLTTPSRRRRRQRRRRRAPICLFPSTLNGEGNGFSLPGPRQPKALPRVRQLPSLRVRASIARA